MTFVLELNPEEERAVSEAQAQGVDVTAYLRSAITRLPAQAPPPLTLEEWEAEADLMTEDIDPNLPPLSDYAVSRESFYEGRP